MVLVGGSASRYPSLTPLRHLHTRLLLSLACPVWVGPVGAAGFFLCLHLPHPASHPPQLGESLVVTWEPLGSHMLKGLQVSFLRETNTFSLRFKECGGLKLNLKREFWLISWPQFSVTSHTKERRRDGDGNPEKRGQPRAGSGSPPFCLPVPHLCYLCPSPISLE